MDNPAVLLTDITRIQIKREYLDRFLFSEYTISWTSYPRSKTRFVLNKIA